MANRAASDQGGADPDERLMRRAYHRSIRMWVAALRSPSPSVRIDAARALGELGASEATHALAALVGDLPLLRLRVIIARVVHFLLGLPTPSWLQFGDERIDVRVAAVEALGRIGGERAANALTKALADEAAPVRTAAARALSRLNVPPDELAIRQSLAQVARVATGQEIRLLALRVCGERARGVADEAVRIAVHKFTRALGHSDPNVRLEAVSGLLRLNVRPSPAVAAWLLASLGDRDALLRIEAAKLLALGDDTVRRRLIERLRVQLRSEDWQVRRTALIGLREVGSPEVFLDLAASFQREEYAALRELALVGAMATGVAEARALAEQALGDESASVRSRARKLLGLGRGENEDHG